jgi:LisH
MYAYASFRFSRLSLPPLSIASLLPPFLLYSPRFNIYILDYCKKRGYHKTANQLVAEAEIPPESKPPINAQQGLLFEFVPSSLLYLLLTHLAHSKDGGAFSGSSSKPRTAVVVPTMQSSTPRSVTTTRSVSFFFLSIFPVSLFPT